METRVYLIILIFSTAILSVGCGRPAGVAGSSNSASSASDTFSSINANIITPICLQCHNTQAPLLTSYAQIIAGGSVVPFNAAASTLYTQVSSGIMPLGGPPLPSSAVQAIYNWIQAGAPQDAPVPTPVPTPIPGSTPNPTPVPTPPPGSTPSPTPVPTPVSTPNPTPIGSCTTIGATWYSQSIGNQTTNVTIAYDATPGMNDMDGVTGVSVVVPTGYSNIATSVRFNSAGDIDAISGSNYQAASTIPYHAGTTYHFVLDIYVATHTYSAYVSAPGGALQPIITNLPFRSTQSADSKFNYLSAYDAVGTHTLCNVTVTPF